MLIPDKIQPGPAAAHLRKRIRDHHRNQIIYESLSHALEIHDGKQITKRLDKTLTAALRADTPLTTMSDKTLAEIFPGIQVRVRKNHNTDRPEIQVELPEMRDYHIRDDALRHADANIYPTWMRDHDLPYVRCQNYTPENRNLGPDHVLQANSAYDHHREKKAEAERALAQLENATENWNRAITMLTAIRDAAGDAFYSLTKQGYPNPTAEGCRATRAADHFFTKHYRNRIED